tara:strand:- start:13820 stop:14473 length:654 start_codon:yes stop_codon:yes gene_type:complete
MKISPKVKTLLKNKYVLYAVFALTLTNMFGYLMMKNYEALMIFSVVGLLTRYFSKNMIIIMGFALSVTNMWVSGKFVKEGLIGEDDENDHADEEPEQDTESKICKAKNDDGVEFDGTLNDEGTCVPNEKKEAMSKLAPASVDGDDSVGPNLDYAGSLEAAYDNLDKLLDSDAMKQMGNDTEKLAQKQKKLMGNISKLQPLMKTASSMLEKLNFVNNE